LVEQTARFEEVKIPLREPLHGLDAVSGILGIPEWWPTGSRICMLIAHGSQIKDPLLESLARDLTSRKYLTLRFLLPHVEAKKTQLDPPAVLKRLFQSAVGLVNRDPTAAPAHIFVGGKNQGALAAAHAATGPVRAAGLFMLGYPLHRQGDVEKVQAERLYRATTPMLFVQGDKDRYCDLKALKETLKRVGAPWDTHVVRSADHALRLEEESGRLEEDVFRDVLAKVEGWTTKVLGE